MEGSYVPKLAELGVLCMPASFVTYQRPQGLMQGCLRHWAESQYLCIFSSYYHGNTILAVLTRTQEKSTELASWDRVHFLCVCVCVWPFETNI